MHVLSGHASLVPLFATLAALRAISAIDTSACSSSGVASTGCAAPRQAGIALLQKRRTLTAVDAGDGEVPTGPPVQGTAAAANASAVPEAPCTAFDCGNASKAKQADALIAAPDSWKTAVNETSPSSYSLTAAGQGDGLSGSVASRGGEPEPLNETLPPIAQEHIEPFGYPGAGILLELHLPKVTLRELHTSSRGSLAQFLLEVREEIGKSAEVHESRVSILSIHGRYKHYESDGYFRMRSDRTDHMAGSQHLEEEVVVRFEILPGSAQDTDPKTALKALRDQLSSPDSSLMKGPLGMTLSNATVTLSTPVTMVSQSRMSEHHGMTHMSAMAWPIGISAAFIGVLIWLAAY